MVYKVLDISTAHITSAAADWLNSNPPITLYPKAEYGWFIYAQSDEYIDVPESIMDCIKHAQSLGCDWLVLDRDGETIDNLKTYEW